MYLHLRSGNFYFLLNRCLNTIYHLVAFECERSTAVPITANNISTIHAFIDDVSQDGRAERRKDSLSEEFAQTKFWITGSIRTAAISAVFSIAISSYIQAVIKINVLGIRGMIGQQECTGADGIVPMEIDLGFDVNIALCQFVCRNKGSFWLKRYLKRRKIGRCIGNGQVIENAVCGCNLFRIGGNIFFCGSRNASRKRGSESSCEHAAKGNGSYFISSKNHKDSFLSTGNHPRNQTS